MDGMNLTDIKNRYKIIGNDPALDAAIEVAVKAARTDLPVLIIGESGSGKEVFSRIIHDSSLRRGGNFLPINCGSIPTGTVNSELFGHEKGAFTGAVSERKGYFEEADGGTLFMDEVAELPVDTQAQLLRVLQSGEYLRVGSSKIRHTDVRLIAATNVNLYHAISRGRFRSDLFYRLNAITVKIPPLRERREDIQLLFRKFCADFAEKYAFRGLDFTRDALQMLKDYRWPGNVRELMSVAERLCTMESQPVLSQGEGRVPITSVILSRYLPEETAELLPALSGNASGEGFSSDEKEMIVRSIFQLKQEVDSLREMVVSASRPGTAPTACPVVPAPAHVAAPNAVVTASASAPGSSSAAFIPDAEDQSPEEQEQPLAPPPSPQPASLREAGFEMIRQSLQRHGGNRAEVALELGISDRTLYRRIAEMKKKGLWQD